MEKTFVCLANSRIPSGLDSQVKPKATLVKQRKASERVQSGRCIAGKEFTDEDEDIGGWIRPVRAGKDQALLDSNCTDKYGSIIRPFDIVKVSLVEKGEHPAQEENYIVEEGHCWKNIRQFSGHIDSLLDSPDTLWVNGNSSAHGVNDLVPKDLVTSPGQSLYFISPSNFEYVVQYERGLKQVRAEFEYNESDYSIMITDPFVERMYLDQGKGRYEPSRDIYMTVSLGQDYKGSYYKLAEAVFEIIYTEMWSTLLNGPGDESDNFVLGVIGPSTPP